MHVYTMYTKDAWMTPMPIVFVSEEQDESVGDDEEEDHDEDDSGNEDAGEHVASGHIEEHIDVDLLQRRGKQRCQNPAIP
ncbi:hypothetical protein KCU98_g11413, partial [Aureobasidium melanogenum]